MTLDFVFKTCTGKTPEQWAEDSKLDWFNAYADQRQDAGKGILVADWNQFPHQGDTEFNWNKGRKFQTILENMGYQLEWNDQTSRCDDCGGAITEGPDYHGDSAHYAILGDCEKVCAKCIRDHCPDEYLKGLENNPHAALFISGVKPADHGYKLVEGDFENGFHPGQTDDPVAIYKRLRDKYPRLLFSIDDSGQFDTHFSVWTKVEDE